MFFPQFILFMQIIFVKFATTGCFFGNYGKEK